MKTLPSSRNKRIIVSLVPCVSELLHNVKNTEFEIGVRELLLKLKSETCLLEIIVLGKKLLEASSNQLLEVAELVRRLEPLRTTRSLLREANYSIEEFTAEASVVFAETMYRKSGERPSKAVSKAPKAKYRKIDSIEKKYKQLSIDPTTMRLKTRSPPPNSSLESVKKAAEEKSNSVPAPEYNGHRPSFLFVQHIGISATGFKCFVENCRFPEEPDEEEFRSHLSKHKSVFWNSICTACNDDVGTSFSRTVCDELEHLLISHTDNQFLKELSQPLAAEMQVGDGEVPPNVIDEPEITELELPESPSEQLRPWIPGDFNKNKAAVLLKKKTQRLEALFKCMGNHCTFATSSGSHFAKHLKLHRDSDLSFYRCAYCLFKDSNANILVNHIETVHGHDRYRCDLCFYRSCSKENVFAHRMFYHISSKAIAFKCENICAIDVEHQLELLAKKPDKYQIVPLVTCPLCVIPIRHDNMVDLEQHLKVYHINSTHFQCKKCSNTVALKSIRDHFESCLKIGMFQCVHCCFGTNFIMRARMHLVDQHPSEIAVICYRDQSAEGQFFFGKFPLRSSLGIFDAQVFSVTKSQE